MKNFGKEDIVDQIFRQKLKNVEISETDHIWQNIEKSLNNSNRKTGAIGFNWLKAISILILVSLGGFIFYRSGIRTNTDGKNNLDKKETVKSTDKVAINLDQSSENESKESSSNPWDHERELDNKSVTNGTADNLQTYIISKTKDQNLRESTECITNQNEAITTKRNRQITNKAKTSLDRSIRNNNNLGSPNSGKTNTNLSNNTGQIRIQDAIYVADNQANTNSKDVQFSSNDAQAKATQKINYAEAALDYNSKLKVLLGPVVYDRKPKKLKKNEYEDGCNIFKNDRKRFYIDVYYAPELTTKSIKGKAPIYDKYAMLRRSDEKFAVSYSIGSRGSVVFENGLALRTGLSYSVIKENFNYLNGEIKKTVIVPNPITNKNDTTYTVEPIISSSRNYYKFYDMPFVVGYERELRDFVFSVNAGVGINLAARQEGIIYLNETKAYYKLGSRSDAVSNIYKQNVGLSLLFNFGLNYRLNQRMRLLIEPSFRYYAQGLTSKDYVLDHKSLQTGLMLGLRYKVF